MSLLGSIGPVWIILGGYGLLLWVLSPWSQDRSMFYEGQSEEGGRVGFWILTGSVIISWIFAKSITNAANLGAEYGLVGGIAYAGWYLSIPVAGVVIYFIRRQFDINSLTGYLRTKYGKMATLAFMLAIFIRLFNEIWSNTMVVGTYFGAKGTTSYYLACFLFTAITLAYSLRGGLRSSLITDAVQVLLMVFFVALVLGYIVPGQSGELVRAGDLTMSGGLDLLLVGLLQALSYPFHDPVLTDRGFIADSETILKSFLVAGVVAAVLIVTFSLVGVHAYLGGMSIQDDAPPQVARSLGISVLIMMNIIMLTSAGSTIDSTFSSLAKEIGVDLPNLTKWFPSGKIAIGRTVMVGMAILGNLPLFSGAKILQATTISGTMVMGFAPIFLFFWWDRPGSLSFHIAFWCGLLIGLGDLFFRTPPVVAIGNGAYAGLLGVNFYGLLLCTGLYVVTAYFPLSNHVSSSV
jgi:Na+/proline symporter